MAAIKNSVCTTLKKVIFGNDFQKSVVLEANRLEPRSGPTCVGPDLGSSQFATVQNTARSVSHLKWVKIDIFV